MSEKLVRYLEAYLHKHELETQCNRASIRCVSWTQGFRHRLNMCGVYLTSVSRMGLSR